MEELLLAISTTKGMRVRLWCSQGNRLGECTWVFFFFGTWIYFSLVKEKIPFQLRSRINAIFMNCCCSIVAFLTFIVLFFGRDWRGKTEGDDAAAAAAACVSARCDKIGLPVFPVNCFLPFSSGAHHVVRALEEAEVLNPSAGGLMDLSRDSYTSQETLMSY